MLAALAVALAAAVDLAQPIWAVIGVIGPAAFALDWAAGHRCRP